MVKQDKKRIGFVSYWGWGRGQSQVTRMYYKMLKDDFDIYILKQFDNPISDDFKFNDLHITEHKEYDIEHDFFEQWITDNKLDAVVFNEYKQWGSGYNDLIPIAHKHNVKVYAYLVWEKYGSNDMYESYDKILCPTLSFCRFLRTHKFRKFTYIPYSIDLSEFDLGSNDDKDEFIFFHPGGWGGVHNRKSTEEVIEAFSKLNINNNKVKLIVTSQKGIEVEALPDNVELINQDLPRKELINIYKKCDCVVMPSKWDTVGISILESMAFGKPVITTNAPPMNEFIKDGVSGLTTPVSFKDYKDIYVMAAIVDIDKLKNNMQNMVNNIELTKMLGKNARYLVEQKYNLDKNKHLFITFLKNELND